MAKRKGSTGTRYTAIGKTPEPSIVHHTITLHDGRIVSLFVNRDTNLVVLDIVDTNERGGFEVYRRTV